MSMETDNLNVAALQPLPTPDAVKRQLPASDAVLRFVADSRQRVRGILERRDHRLLVVVGPCSIHDLEAARDYAARLKPLAEETADALYIVMRTYFEKPRTTVGWKGLINDPHLDDSFHVEHGIHLARALLLDIAALELPLATEALDPIAPQYLQDLITWSAIGARTTESQTHREMASGLSSAVGFKNSTDGTLDTAVNALKSVAGAHRFLGIDSTGAVAVIHTRGNANAHIVLRGGHEGPNYDAPAVASCEAVLAAAGLAGNIMVDCSHANANKDHRRQLLVADSVAEQIGAGNRSIIGLMVESNIAAGKQPLGAPEQLAYGVSITDACLGWQDTEALLRRLAAKLRTTLVDRLPGYNGTTSLAHDHAVARACATRG